jgi:hypothetical protein
MLSTIWHSQDTGNAGVVVLILILQNLKILIQASANLLGRAVVNMMMGVMRGNNESRAARASVAKALVQMDTTLLGGKERIVLASMGTVV